MHNFTYFGYHVFVGYLMFIGYLSWVNLMSVRYFMLVHVFAAYCFRVTQGYPLLFVLGATRKFGCLVTRSLAARSPCFLSRKNR